MGVLCLDHPIARTPGVGQGQGAVMVQRMGRDGGDEQTPVTMSLPPGAAAARIQQSLRQNGADAGGSQVA